MSQITISSFPYTLAAPPYTTGSVTLRVWFVGGPSQQFIHVDGNIIPFGNPSSFYKEIPCSVAGNTIITVPAFTLPATDNSSNPSVVARAQFFVNGTASEYLFSDWIITATLGSSISYNSLFTYNLLASIPYTLDPTYLTAPQVAALISTAIGGLNFATTTLAGITRLSTAPVSSSIPIAVGDNDPRVNSLVLYSIVTYGASTSGSAAANATAIAAAVTAAAAANAGIYVPVGTFSTNSVTISVPVTFAPGSSILSPATGQVVTLTTLLMMDNGRHFTNALSGQGTISFTGNKVQTVLRPEWWGAAHNVESTAAIQAAIDAADAARIPIVFTGERKFWH
jgi:hypothetical protein